MLPSASSKGSPTRLTAYKGVQRLSPVRATRSVAHNGFSLQSRIATIAASTSAAANENGGSTLAETEVCSSANRHNAGRIELIVGPMFAGKSTALLRKARESIAKGLEVVLVKSSKDDRYSQQHVITHDGDRLPCHTASTLQELRSSLGGTYTSAHVVAIDEAQFFPDLYRFVVHAADNEGKTVYVAGLDGDFKRQRFGDLLDLIPMADHVEKLKGTCQFCEQPSLFSLRVAADDRQELVGGRDKYVPTCRQHYVEMSRVRAPNSP